MINLSKDNWLTIDRLLPVVVFISLPALYFSEAMPFWVPPLAVGQLIFIFLLRVVLSGQLLGRPALNWLAGALFLLALVSLGVTPNLGATLPQTYSFIANLAVFGTVALYSDVRHPWWCGWGILAAGLGLALFLSLGTFFVWYRLPYIGARLFEFLVTLQFRQQLIPGYNPNMTGGVLALFWVPALVLAWRGTGWLQRDVAKVTVVILTGPIILAEPRGAWVGIGLALVAVTLLRSRRWLYLWGAAVILMGVGIYGIGRETLVELATSPYDTLGWHSMQQRWELWQQAGAIISAHPIGGVGLGVIEAQRLIGPEMRHNHAHNLYLQIAAETGLLGLGIHLAFFGTLLYLLVRRVLGERQDYRQALALGLLGSLIVFLTHGLVEVISYYAWWVAPVLWALLGLMAAVGTASAASEAQNA